MVLNSFLIMGLLILAYIICSAIGIIIYEFYISRR